MVRAKGCISPYPIIFPRINRLVCLRPSRSLHLRSCFPRFAQENTFQHKMNFLPPSRKRVVFSHYYYSVWHLFSHSYREPQEPPHAPLQEECDLQVALFSVQFIGGASIHAIPTAIHSFVMENHGMVLARQPKYQRTLL